MEVHILTPKLVLEAIVRATERNDLVSTSKSHGRRDFRDATNGFSEATAVEQETPFDFFRQSYPDQIS